MSKQYNINWRDKDQKELERTVKNFNAKLARVTKKLQKTNPSHVKYLPDRMKASEIKAKSLTRADFNRQIKSTKRFSKRGSEEIRTTKGGKTITKFALRELSIKTGVINRKRNIELKKIKIGSGAVGSIATENLRKRRRIEDVSDRDFDRAVLAIEDEVMSLYDVKRNEQWLSNYTNALIDKLGGFADDVLDFLANKDSTLLASKAIGNAFLQVTYSYGFEDAQMKAERILEEWKIALYG